MEVSISKHAQKRLQTRFSQPINVVDVLRYGRAYRLFGYYLRDSILIKLGDVGLIVIAKPLRMGLRFKIVTVLNLREQLEGNVWVPILNPFRNHDVILR